MATTNLAVETDRITLGDASYPRVPPQGYCGGIGCCGAQSACFLGHHADRRCRCNAVQSADAYGDEADMAEADLDYRESAAQYRATRDDDARSA